MFNRKEKPSETKTMTEKKKSGRDLSSVNMVSEGTEIIGTLKTQSDIRIAGQIEGEAKVEGKIIVASSGHINGNINSNDADIAGRIEGEVHALGKLTLRQSAVVEGDLYAQNLIVEEGATFNGACHMRDYATKNESELRNTDKDSSPDEDTVAV